MEVAWLVAGCRKLVSAFFTYSTPLLCNINSHLNGKQYSHCLIKEACDIIECEFLKLLYIACGLITFVTIYNKLHK